VRWRAIAAAYVPQYWDNGLETLMFTYRVCNEKNHACLAGLQLLAQWLHRFRPGTVAAEPDLLDVWLWCRRRAT